VVIFQPADELFLLSFVENKIFVFFIFIDK